MPRRGFVFAAFDLPKRFDIPPPLTGGCSEGLGAFSFFFKQQLESCFPLSVWVFSPHSFWTSSSLDVPAGVTQEEGRTGFLIHLLSAVRALIEKDSAIPFPRRL